jgi:putative MFS transporter
LRLPDSAHVISENIPSSKRGKLVLGAFAFQAIGALAGTAVGFFVLSVLPELSAWRWMFASAIIPAVLVTLGPFSAAAVEICSWRRSQHFPKDLAARFIPQRYDSSPAGIGGSRGQGVARIDRERVSVDRDRVDALAGGLASHHSYQAQVDVFPWVSMF